MNRSIFVTRKLPEQIMSKFRAAGISVRQWDKEVPVPRDILLNSVEDITGLFCMLTDKIDRELVKKSEKLRVISTMSVGFDHVDTSILRDRGIRLGFTPDVLTDATAELTVALLLSASRRLPEAVQAAKDGTWGPWNPFWMCGPGLSGSTVGIIGMGRIGLEVAKRLRSFNVSKFLYSGRGAKPDLDWAEFVPFHDLLRRADFVISCCALNDDTKLLFNAEAFKLMKESAVFVNSSRGGVVNQEDLCAALTSGQIAAAGLDVTTPEPLPTDHELFRLPNCIVLPHIGSATVDTRMKMAELAADNLIAGLDDKEMPAEVAL